MPQVEKKIKKKNGKKYQRSQTSHDDAASQFFCFFLEKKKDWRKMGGKWGKIGETVENK